MKFKREFLAELVGNGKCEEATVISDDYCGHSRWSVQHRVIFGIAGKFYATRYSVGATENQDEQPYEYAEAEVECPEVWPVEKTVTVYEAS